MYAIGRDERQESIVIIKTVIEEVRAVIAAINDVVMYLKKRKLTKIDLYCGKWTNEGLCTGPQPDHYLDIELSPATNGVAGVVSSRCQKSSLSMASFHGEIRRGRLQGKVMGVNKGNLVVYGKVSFALCNGNLHFHSKDVLAGFLPEEAELWRQ